MEPPTKCGYMSVKQAFSCPGISDEVLLYIYGSFNGENSLGRILRDTSAKFNIVTEDVFMRVVAMFFQAGLLSFRHDKRAGSKEKAHA